MNGKVLTLQDLSTLVWAILWVVRTQRPMICGDVFVIRAVFIAVHAHSWSAGTLSVLVGLNLRTLK